MSRVVFCSVLLLCVLAAHVFAQESRTIGVGNVIYIDPQGYPEKYGSSDEGVAAVDAVKSGGDWRLRVVGRSPGSTTILYETKYGPVTVEVNVTATDINQLRALLGDFEPPLTFKAAGDKVFVEGRISSKKDLARFSRILTEFPGIVNMVDIQAGEQLVDIAVTLVEVEASSENGFSLLDISPSGSISLSVPILPDSARNNISATLSATSEVMKAIQALVSSGKGKVVAQPRVVTMDNQEATMSVGGSIPYRVLTADAQGLQYMEYGINLAVRPQMRSQEIVLELAIESSEPVKKSGEVDYSLSSRKVKAKVAVQKGKSLVFARLYNTVSSGGSRVGCLFPLFGVNTAERKRELLVVVTPSPAGEGGIGYDNFKLIKSGDIAN